MTKVLKVIFLSLLVVPGLCAQGTKMGEPQPPLIPAELEKLNNKTVSLFLLVGQSNMKGRGAIDMKPKQDKRILFFHSKEEKWFLARDPIHAKGTPDLIDGKDNSGTGPGVSFAKALINNEKNLVVGLIPAAQGGAPISLYEKDGKLYTRSLELVRKAKQALPVKAEIKGILWLQGESDATPERYQVYERKLIEMVDRYRSDLGDPDLPFIACTIGSFINKPKFSKAAEINKVLLKLPKLRDNTFCIDARDVTGHIGDSLHYNSKSQKIIGERYAEAFIQLKKKE